MLQLVPAVNGHGSYCHLYPFPSIVCRIRGYDYPHKTWKEMFDFQVNKANVEDRLGIQCTLTMDQITRQPELTQWLQEAGFKVVFTHVNPNTQRTIVTFFLDPPVYEGKVVQQGPFTPEWYKKNAAKSADFGMFLDANTRASYVAYHAGGCCGWKSICNVRAPQGDEDQIEQYVRLAGEMRYFDGKKVAAWQGCFDLVEYRQYLDVDCLSGYLGYMGFNMAHEYVSGLTGRKMVWVVRHETPNPLPLYKYTK